ncbi:MAG: alpha/beta hydrolase [Deferribacteres bacterium]|nr:alpha/beta hydrolase [candidate division KSB1 bacterium]MCB9500857.1 alpha/beta hydrolase [Deferribacteres bacterium]
MITKIFRFILRITLVLAVLWVVLFALHKWRNSDITKPPFGYPSEKFLFAAHYLGFEPLVNLKPDVPPEIKEFKNIVYKEVDSLQLALDIYQPADMTAPRPAIVFIHGGSWNWGHRSDYLVYLIDFAKRGWVTATVSYRLRKQAQFPAAVEDVKCAIKWIKNHAAEYNIDPDNIALVGGSAGAHLAMLTAFTAGTEDFSVDCGKDTTTTAVKAIVDIYGPVDLTVDYAVSNKNVQKFLGGTYEKIPEVFTTASPQTYLSKDIPPTLILHGTIDTLVPIEQSESLFAQLQALGVVVEFYTLPGWPHAMDIAQNSNRYMQYVMTEFFKKTIPVEK